jgi:hypothetical protein
MKHLNKKWLVLISIVLGVGVGLYSLKHRWKEPELPYKAPNLPSTSEAPVERTKYEEYEDILENKQKGNNKPKKSLVRFGLAKLFKPQSSSKHLPPITPSSPTKPLSTDKHPSKKPPAPTYFFSYQGEEKTDMTTTAITEQPHFFKARVYKEQKVKDKGAVVVKLQEKVELLDKTLPAGTLLFGEAQFGKDRMYVTFKVAKWQESHIPLQLEGYDQDLLVGFSAPGLVPSISDQAEGKALQKAMEYSGSGLLQDLGKGAVETFREVKRKKEALLEDRKGVYVRVVDKKQR